MPVRLFGSGFRPGPNGVVQRHLVKRTLKLVDRVSVSVVGRASYEVRCETPRGPLGPQADLAHSEMDCTAPRRRHRHAPNDLP